jgi:hypothetical protein
MLEKGNYCHVRNHTPEIRTCLVFCSEKCVEAVNLRGFQGGLSRVIWKELSPEAPGCNLLSCTVLAEVTIADIYDMPS